MIESIFPRTLRAADWGFGMSIGIVVASRNFEILVSISDAKATFEDFSADHATLKGRRIYRNWWVIFAGNDVEYAPSIMQGVRRYLGTDAATPAKTARQVADSLNDAYWDLIHSQIENRVLRKQKFTVDSFRDIGSKKCTASIYNSLCAKIDKLEISLQFLLYGFSDDDKKGHIFVVDGRETPKCYDTIGVWAIGSGAHAALSSLAFHIDKQELNKYVGTPAEAVYFACEAKFMAESSGLVGKDAVLTIHTTGQDEAQFLFEDEISKVKKIWSSEGAPRVPPDIDQRVAALMKEAAARDEAMKSSSQTSEDQR
jgi:hypothetical protein